jgi:hypothetical protein
VAEKKHGEKDRKRPNQTDIVSSYFKENTEYTFYHIFFMFANTSLKLWKIPNMDGKGNLKFCY